MWGREAWHTVNLLQEPVYLLSGLNYPVRTLGVAAAMAASALPLTTGIDALRQILFPDQANALMPLGWEGGVLAILAVLVLFVAWWSLNATERRARREGRLTVKGQ